METVVLSVGGSLLSPEGGVDHTFIRALVRLVRKHKKLRFVFVCGGGAPARMYQHAAKKITKTSASDLDWIGIAATRLNAEVLRVGFGALAHSSVVTDPSKPLRSTKRVVVAAGWKPGFSSDFVAVTLAKKLRGQTVINLTNVDYVYDKDPKHADAQFYRQLTWAQFRLLVGNTWKPGANVPFDPIASRLAQQVKLLVVIANGKKLKNLDALLSKKSFVGTIIG